MLSQRFFSLCCIIMLLSVRCIYSNTLSPESAFMARVFCGENSCGEYLIVGGLTENQVGIMHLLSIKEGTSDRAILEFDLTGQSLVDSAILNFTGYHVIGDSNLDVYSFIANGLVNAADYNHTDNYESTILTPFIDTTWRAYNLDITTLFNHYISNGYSHLGLLIKDTTGSRHEMYDPVITTVVPEPITLSLFALGAMLVGRKRIK